MLYIMRHGITEWNELNKLQGQSDVPLNEKGKIMARKARGMYKDLHFDVCYASPLKRARQTAEIFLEGSDTPIILDDRLKEMSFGKYEGIVNYRDKSAGNISTLFMSPADYKADSGESLDDLFARTGEFLDEVIYPSLAPDKRILIVGHGAMNSSIVCRMNSLPYSKFWEAGIENCKLMHLC